jgi:hypothetical protein
MRSPNIIRTQPSGIYVGDVVSVRVLCNEDDRGKQYRTIKGQVTEVNDDYFVVVDVIGNQTHSIEWAETGVINVL